MRQRKNELTAERGLELLERHWKWVVVAFWLLFCAWFILTRLNAIWFFSLGDTDDNMRMMQVRGLLHGQGWFDLAQHRLAGSNIHWSRLVDLPIAGLILILRPLLGGAAAERFACGFAPLIPLSLAMTAMAVTIRRLIEPYIWPLGLIILVFACTSTMLMFAPERIDHHGWQLAFVALAISAIADRNRVRGGIVLGVATALSLAIGLEMLPYCVMAGAIVALRWIWDAAEARRLQAYALTLSGGSALGFAAFASNANQAMRCDALTPVWLSAVIAAASAGVG